MRESVPKKYLKSRRYHPEVPRTLSTDTITSEPLETAQEIPVVVQPENSLKDEMESPWRTFVQRWRLLSTRYTGFTVFAVVLSLSMIALSSIPPSILIRIGFAWALPASTLLAVVGLLGVTIVLLLHGLHIALQSDNPNELGAKWRTLGNKRYVAAIAITLGILAILLAIFPAALGSGAASFMGSTFQRMSISALFISGGVGLAFSAVVWHMRALNQPLPKRLSYYDSSEPFFDAQSLANTMQRQMWNAGSRAVNITFFFMLVALGGLIFAAHYFNFMGNAFAGMSAATVMMGVSIALIPVTLILYVGYALLHKSDVNLSLRSSGERLSDAACFLPTPEMPEISECLQKKQKKQKKQTAQTAQTRQTTGISLVTELDPLVVDPSVTQKGKGQAMKEQAVKNDRKKSRHKKQMTGMKREFAQRNRVPTAYMAPSALFFPPQAVKTAIPVQPQRGEEKINDAEL